MTQNRSSAAGKRAARGRRAAPRKRARGSPPSVYRVGGISYLDVPSVDPGRSAAFYHEVLGWTVEERPGAWSFEDGTGHVIGHFLRDRAGSGDAGILPYTYVESIDAVLTRVVAANGKIVRAPYPMGDLWIATFRDPSSNLMGIWQRGPRQG